MAVLLSLSIGIVLGSGFFGNVVFEDLTKRIDSVRATNEELREEMSAVQSHLETADEFVEAVQPRLVGSALRGENIVVLALEGLDDAVREGIVSTVEQAGGNIAAVVTLSERLRLSTTAERDQLALVVRSTSDDKEQLLKEAGFVVGATAAEAAEGLGGAFATLARNLTEAGFLSVEGALDKEIVPSPAAFVVVGGSDVPAPYDAREFVLSLADGIAEREQAVVVAEPSGSEWNVVDAVRDDAGVRPLVATVDHADTVPGRVAVVLGVRSRLENPSQPAGHFGTSPGATAIVPGVRAGPGREKTES